MHTRAVQLAGSNLRYMYHWKCSVSTGSSIEEAASSQENIHATDPHHGDVHGGGEGMSDNLSALTCNWAIRS